jgi:hypothetical protein
VFGRPSGTYANWGRYPALKRWAIFDRPFRDWRGSRYIRFACTEAEIATLWHKGLRGNNAFYEFNAINAFYAFYAFYAINAVTFC